MNLIIFKLQNKLETEKANKLIFIYIKIREFQIKVVIFYQGTRVDKSDEDQLDLEEFLLSLEQEGQDRDQDQDQDDQDDNDELDIKGQLLEQLQIYIPYNLLCSHMAVTLPGSHYLKAIYKKN